MMKTATVKKSKEAAFYAFIEVVSTYSWNTTYQDGTLVKTIMGLLATDLMIKIKIAYEKLSIGDKHYMQRYYDGMQKVNNHYSVDENSKEYLAYLEKSMFPHKNTYKDDLTESIIQENYYKLKKAKLMHYLRDYYSYFSGELKKIHKIGDTGIIIFEFNQKPFSNEKGYHWDEPDRKKFYHNKNTSYVFETFERALINAMFKQHAQSVTALYDHANKPEEEE